MSEPTTVANDGPPADPEGFLFIGLPWLLMDPVSRRTAHGRAAAAVALRRTDDPVKGELVYAPVFSDHDLVARYIARAAPDASGPDVPFRPTTREGMAVLLRDLARLGVRWLAIDPEPGVTRLWNVGDVLAGLQAAIDGEPV